MIVDMATVKKIDKNMKIDRLTVNKADGSGQCAYFSDQLGIGYFNSQAASSNG